VFTKTAAFYDAVYSFKDYPAEAARLRDLITRHTQGGTLLDVACGTGGHLQHLRQWYTVEGLDLDPQLLEVARQRLPDVPLYQADMTAFELGRRFDAVVCLFSSIGYVKTVDGLQRAIVCMARHVAPGGVLVVEPWFAPETYRVGHVAALFVDRPQLKIARMNVSEVRGRISVLNFQYLVGTPDGVEHFAERHELGLFTRGEHEAAFGAAGLEVTYDPQGLIGRGLYVGTWPART
jgi:ubiquinone/menaquinone biosynthesis C-methylase UbiE